MNGHTFWCERTRTDSSDIDCTCAEPCPTVACWCGHTLSMHVGNGAICRVCRPGHIAGTVVCYGYSPIWSDPAGFAALAAGLAIVRPAP